jgi:beta-xylosidase
LSLFPLSRRISALKSTLGALLLGLAGAASAQSASRPAMPMNFPDPFVLFIGDRYLAYSTNYMNVNVPVAFSTDLRTFRPLADPSHPSGFRDALPTLPPWARPGRTWAPEVIRIGDRYVLYFSAHHRRSDRQCIGVATSREPRGPFVPQGEEPLACQHELGGTIDASPFRDSDGTLYLYFKNDGNHPSARTATQIWGQAMAPDGLSLTGEPVALARNDAEWEGHIVEAPYMVRRPSGAYVLFFSANDFAWQRWQRLSSYATGFATCRTPLGPCTDAAENPILASRRDPSCLSGPGHPMVLTADGRDYIAFHAWAARGSCRPAGDARFLHIAPVTWNGDVPSVGESLGAEGE